MTKIIRIGQGPAGSIYCKIKFTDGNLSITGVEGPMSNGDCKGSCGQIDSTIKSYKPHEITFAPGWDQQNLSEFLEIWDRWHLNDLRAGNPEQESYLRANPVSFTYPESHYEAATKALDAAGLNSGYKYGSAWLHEAVPDSVISFLSSLPDANFKPAWV